MSRVHKETKEVEFRGGPYDEWDNAQLEYIPRHITNPLRDCGYVEGIDRRVDVLADLVGRLLDILPLTKEQLEQILEVEIKSIGGNNE